MAYKKNIAEKKASGTYNVTRERGRANISPVYDIKHISKPDFLDENAKKIWDFAVSQLSEEHVKSLDFGVFSRWCSLFSDFCQVTQAIQEGGLLVSDEETGTGMMNNLYDSKIKISNALLNLEKQLGFTPITRNSVIVPDKTEDMVNEFMELLK
jgi:Phage terminase, small subunit